MKIPTLLALLTVALPAQELSETDRQLLLERLAEIKDTSDATVDGRYQVALTAFRKGRASSAAAHDLYLNCVEKVEFEDKLRESSEFRDWKQNHRERTDTPEFRLALRHQLNWLVLTVEAIHAESGSDLAARALGVVESILADAEDLKDHQETLQGSALQSVFAKAYSIKAQSPLGWPDNPVDLSTLYEGLILPPLRDEDSLAALRSHWLKRIDQEGLLVKAWSPAASSDRDRKPAFEKWRREKRPDLVWKMEVDLFRHGDQKKSAVRMLSHLQDHLAHASAPTWIEQFTTLVEGGSLEPVGGLPSEK